jgi:DNA-binding NtrC family response regulator
MTGYYSSDECKNLMGRGVTAIIKKPFNPLDVISSIEKAVAKDNRREGNWYEKTLI